MKKTVKAWALVNARGNLKNWNGDGMYGSAIMRSKKYFVNDDDRQVKPNDKIVPVTITYTVQKANK